MLGPGVCFPSTMACKSSLVEVRALIDAGLAIEPRLNVMIECWRVLKLTVRYTPIKIDVNDTILFS